MLYATINGVQTEIWDLKFSRALTAVGTYSFKAPLIRFQTLDSDYQNAEYSVYFKSTPILTKGYIENATPMVNSQGVADTLEFKGTDELGLLLRYKAKTDANYIDQPLIFIIDDLLTRATDWSLGYALGVSTDTLYTLDLRPGKETLFSQLVAVTELVPDFRFQYGGFVENKYRLDIGELGRKKGIQFTQGVNVQAIKQIPYSAKKVYEIEAFTDTVELQETVNVDYYQSYLREGYLKDTYDSDVSFYGSHPEYPVVELSDGTWVVRDLAAPNGDSIVKRYTSIKPIIPAEVINATPPPDTTPWTPTQINQFYRNTGFSLWSAVVSEFKRINNQRASTYEVEAYLPLKIQDDPLMGQYINYITNDFYQLILNELGQILVNNNSIDVASAMFEQVYQNELLFINPGDKIYLQGKTRQLLHNSTTGEATWLTSYSVEDFYFVSDISYEFTPQMQVKISLKTGIQNFERLYQEDIRLAQRTESSSVRGVVATNPTSYGVESASVTQTSVNPDATMSNGSLGKLFTLPTPSAPMGATSLSFTWYTTNSAAIVETIQNPTIGGSNWIGRATFNGDWNASKSLTIYGLYIYR